MASEHNETYEASDYRLPEDSFMATTGWKISAALAVVGLLGSAAGFVANPERFGYSYLFGFFAVLTLMLGGMFLVLIQHMTAGHWGVTTRRIAEVFGAGGPVILVLAIPLFAGVAAGSFTMYDEWQSHAHGAHGEAGHDEHDEHAEGEGHSALAPSVVRAQEHGEAHGDGGHGDGWIDGFPAPSRHEHHLHGETLGKKAAWLSPGFWYGRAFFYMLIWILIGGLYFRWSTKQDEDADKSLTPKMQNNSYWASFLFGLTLTFAAFDWLMSLEPTWYSTIFGVIIFGGSAMAILAVLCLFGIYFYKNNIAKGAINAEHVMDLSRLMYGFICFWTYVQFSQWMLIWYAGIPEEATWFHRRWQGGFEWVSLFLFFGHFVAPFYLLMSRVQKRNLGWLKTMCLWMLFMHVVDIYWFILPQAHKPAHLDSAVVYDLAALLFCGGVFFTFVLKTLAKVPLIPIGDPRLGRSVHHHQSY